VIVVFVLGANFAFTSNAFRIEQVNVVGTHNSTLIADIQSMGMQGQNIFLINVARMTDRIQASPLVASASLDKQWPNQLTVSVVERVPALLWQIGQGIYGVDRQGVVIAPASNIAGTDRLMTVVDTRVQGKGQLMRPGVHLRQSDVAFALTVFSRLPQLTGITEFRLRFDSTMNVSATNGIAQPTAGSYIIESQQGWIAYLGGADDVNPLDNKLIELQTILAMAQKQQLTLATVDLRYGLHPVYTLKN
jgi:hypothetical protein